MAVLMTPGATTLAVTPDRPRSSASRRVMPSMPAFDAAYDSPSAPPCAPATEPMLMIRPRPRGAMTALAALQPWKHPVRLTSRTRCHSSGDVSSTPA